MSITLSFNAAESHAQDPQILVTWVVKWMNDAISFIVFLQNEMSTSMKNQKISLFFPPKIGKVSFSNQVRCS